MFLKVESLVGFVFESVCVRVRVRVRVCVRVCECEHMCTLLHIICSE